MSWAVVATECVVSTRPPANHQNTPVRFFLPFCDHGQTITKAPTCDLLLLTDCGENAGCHSLGHRPIGFRAR
jgi:hypothetical protein